MLWLAMMLISWFCSVRIRRRGEQGASFCLETMVIVLIIPFLHCIFDRNEIASNSAWKWGGSHWKAAAGFRHGRGEASNGNSAFLLLLLLLLLIFSWVLVWCAFLAVFTNFPSLCLCVRSLEFERLFFLFCYYFIHFILRGSFSFFISSNLCLVFLFWKLCL